MYASWDTMREMSRAQLRANVSPPSSYIYIYNADVRDLGRDVTSARLSVDIYPSISSTLGVFTSAKNCVRRDLRADASRSEIRSVSRMAVRK